jgi:sirohydrochlorin cobaltochelatase
MEEPPLVSDWRKLTKTRHVVVVPFFISDGLHSYEDIPRLLGIADDHPERSEGESKDPAELPSGFITGSLDFARDDVQANRGEIFRSNPYKVDNRLLFYASSIGTDPGFADIILEQALSAKS